jgi:hypothetical protein
VQRTSAYAQQAVTGRDAMEMGRPQAKLIVSSSAGVLGNQAALRRLGRMQCKLEIGAVHDPLGTEADRGAEQVMRMPDAGAAVTGSDG